MIMFKSNHSVFNNMSNRGFTLLELMVAVAIVSIIAAIAVPSYSQYTTRVKRGEGKATLMDIAQKLERYKVDNNGTYTKAPLSTWLPGGLTENGHYKLTLTENGTTYTLTATPQGNQAAKDAGCGNLTYTETGVKGISGTQSKDKCW